MALTLTDSVLHEVRKDGDTTFSLAAEKSFKIETSPDGEEILNVEVPTGKAWLITLSVRIIETDA